MMRQSSHSSSNSNSPSASSPKPKSFFVWPRKKRTSISGGPLQKEQTIPQERLVPGLEFVPKYSEDPIVSTPPILPDIEPTRSKTIPSPDPFFGSTHDSEYIHLKENIRRLRKVPPGSDPKKVDNTWEVYKRVRDECLQLCKSLLQKSQNGARSHSLESSDPTDARSSYSGGSLVEIPSNVHPSDQRVAAIREYKSIQEQMVENFRACLLATYIKNEPGASERQMETFLEDGILRKSLIARWRETSIHAMKSEKLLFWEQFKIRSLNFDKLKLDLKAIAQLFDAPILEVDNTNSNVREYVISKNGDTILEFGNKGLEGYPILQFRVSSHHLAESSQFFGEMLLPKKPVYSKTPSMENRVPPPPARHVDKDGMEVKVYRMPQIELNKHEALTIVLHAAHGHNVKVPRHIEFPVFVSVAEVCLKYQCTSPLELHVEHRWLPPLLAKAGEDSPDGLLLIGYAFGHRELFSRTSKSAILGSLDDEEIDEKELWPQIVKDKIKAIRAAKLAQIHDCCRTALQDYLKPPADSIDSIRKSSVGSLELTTTPRCPKGSHLCDATNLGSLMLVYNELHVLSSLMDKIGFPGLPQPPRRSLKGLMNSLRLMPSAPQVNEVHSGVCDYAPAFRSSIDDIYNSITGLTLHDVTGRWGWALSKNDHGPGEPIPDMTELPADPNLANRPSTIFSSERMSLATRDSDDVIEVIPGRPGSNSSSYSPTNTTFPAPRPNPSRPPNLTIPTTNNNNNSNKESKILTSEIPKITSPPPSNSPPPPDDHDLYDASPPFTPFNSAPVMSAEEANEYLYNYDRSSTSLQEMKAPPGDSQKVLLVDLEKAGGKPEVSRRALMVVVGAEDKVRSLEVDEEKVLREEKEGVLGLGCG